VSNRQRLPAGEKLRDHFGIHGGTASGDPADGVDELADVRHPVLEQVADTAVRGAEQVAGVERLDVLGEHEDRQAGHLDAGSDGRLQTFVGECRREIGRASCRERV